VHFPSLVYTVIIKGHCWKTFINTSLKSENDIYFNFFFVKATLILVYTNIISIW